MEELSAMLPKDVLYAMYEEATREKYSFWYVNLRARRKTCSGTIRPQVPRKRAWGRSSARWWGSCWGAGATVSATTSSAALPRSGWWTPGGPTRSGPGKSARALRHRGGVSGVEEKRHMTTIYCDSRKRVAGDDASFEMDIGETIHMQTGAKLSVLKFRVADAFLSTDRGQYLYWEDQALGTLNWATLPVGAYTGTRLASWISSNYALRCRHLRRTNQ